ncbi:thiamine ABC transporter substrate-binding protein [Xylanimonas allomyrinae]|uniref:Thiamine ABC transporter substrate-binding protein n=1 Tax=Xylanimonas allomyrinae TaxID=2509459 RepID=A0A4P6EQJ9_9MICO|nr:thiamine ABC transporter substrate-binding protein [Xylanimonas allomyrinae]QAY64123.1 thiamine ABC transporter substrate-binding protein [Xylanimonas allomyrinae]
MTTPSRRTLGCAAAVAVLGLLGACSGEGSPDAAGSASAGANTVTLVTHDSWAVSDDVIAAFEKESGLTVKQVPMGDAGTLANQVVLTKDSPLGDVVFGIDNTFASRVLDTDTLKPYTPAGLAESARQYVLGDGALNPIDVGDVCLNTDTAWFAEHGLAEPETLEDVAKPEYKDLLVALNPASSSPGMAFMLATIGAFGDDGFGGEGWTGYWAALRANGVTVSDSWEDGYYSEFSGAGEGGTRPIVVSYATSPAFTVTKDGAATTTRALLGTCFRQVEYAGIFRGAQNPEGAAKLVDFLVSQPFQADVPGQMYMYPADSSIELPAEWTRFAPLADAPFDVPAADIAANRDAWIEKWTATVIG